MAERALPAARAPRTVTVQVRSLGVIAITIAILAVISWMLWWVTGLQPISLGSSTFQRWA